MLFLIKEMVGEWFYYQGVLSCLEAGELGSEISDMR